MYTHLPKELRPTKKRTRDTEVALIQSLSSSLDAFNNNNKTSNGVGTNNSIGTTTTNSTAKLLYYSQGGEGRRKQKKKQSATDISQNAAKHFLSAKMLMKNIAKAVVSNEEGESSTTSSTLIDRLVEHYKPLYPALSYKLLIDEIGKYNTTVSSDEVGNCNNDDDELLRFGNIINIVDEGMQDYQQRIDALKKSRKSAATAAKSNAPSSTVKRPRGRPLIYSKDKKDNTPENKLIQELVKRYGEARKVSDGRVPNGFFESMVNATKKDMQLEDVDLGSMVDLNKKIRRMYGRTANENVNEPSQNKILENEIYSRYERAKIANGGKLPAGTLNGIIEVVKQENAISQEIKMSSLKQKVQARFTKNHPEFTSSSIPNDGSVKIGNLTAEQKSRRQTLLNEVTARYVEMKASKKKLPDGTLERIIEETKNDLGIHEFAVPSSSIRGRINRKSLVVKTQDPTNVIDNELVKDINKLLGQGISVTRDKGLETANKILQKKSIKEKETIVLDAQWWRAFLDRSKGLLACEK